MTAPTAARKIITPEEAAAELVKRREARASLREFAKQAWHIIEGGRPLRAGWAFDAVCDHAQAWAAGDIRDLVVNIPPRHTKSTICSVCLLPWMWIDRPDLQFMSLSYSATLSVRDHRKSRLLIENNWYQTRWGHSFNLALDQNTKARFDNDKGGYRFQTTITGTVTGDGADRIVLDDPNSMSDLSEAGLALVESFWSDVMPTRINDPKTGGTLVVQQRGHERDLTGTIKNSDDAKNWVFLTLPLEFEPERRCVTVVLPSTGGKKWADPRKEAGELLSPERMGPKEVERWKRRLGSEYNIAGQLQQRPSPGEGGIIKRKWFQIWPHAKPPKMQLIMLSIDTAVSEKKEAAYSAITVWGVFLQAVENKGGEWSNVSDPENPVPTSMVPNVLLLNMWRERLEYVDLRKRIKRMADNYLDDGPLNLPPMKPSKVLKPGLVLIESKSSGISLIQELRRAGVLVTPFNPDKLGDKTARVRLVTPMLEGGRVWVPGKGPDYKKPMRWADSFIEQAISFPKAASRDLVDTMTQALWRLWSTGWIAHPDDEQPEEKPTHGSGAGSTEAIY